MTRRDELTALLDETGLQKKQFALLIGRTPVSVDRWTAQRETAVDVPILPVLFLRAFAALKRDQQETVLSHALAEPGESRKGAPSDHPWTVLQLLGVIYMMDGDAQKGAAAMAAMPGENPEVEPSRLVSQFVRVFVMLPKSKQRAVLDGFKGA